MNKNKFELNPTFNEFSTLIPLRGGSKGIPRKNLMILKNKPLYSYVAESSLKAGIKTFISTEDQEIMTNCQSYYPDINILRRPNDLATDTASTESVVTHFLSSIENTNHIILLQATSPLTSSLDIQSAISKYLDNGCKPLVSVVNQHFFLWSKDGKALNYDPFQRPRRQEWEGLYIENGAIYIFSREYFLDNGSRCNDRSTLYLMQTQTLFELDTNDDLKIISALL